jgi:transposase
MIGIIKASNTTLEERRRIIIRMKENGGGPAEIAAAAGCSGQTIYPLWNSWKRSRNKAQEKEIQKAVTDKYPDRLKLDFALRTREAVKLMIRRKYNADTDCRGIFEAAAVCPAKTGNEPPRP